MSNRWFVCPEPRPAAALRLYVLPYAGAGPSAFRQWPAALGADVEVWLAHLPGRERRIGEPPEFEAADLAGALPTEAPYAIYGHSMGARLGYELVRELRRAGAPLPSRLFVGACRPPDLATPGRFDGLSELDDDALTARLAAVGSLPAEVLAEPELVELLLPMLRADFAWLDRYVHQPGEPLPLPISAFAGATDTGVPAEQMRGWDRHGGPGFTLRTLPGGHFFVNEVLPELAGHLLADLRLPSGAGR